MNFLKDTTECLKSELDLFMMPPLNTSIEQGQFEAIIPTVNQDKSIQFSYIGTDEYIDLSKCFIDLTARIYKADGLNKVNLETADAVGPINNFFHSAISQIEIKLNNTIIENTNTTYPYKAYLSDLLNYNQDAKESYLQSTLFVKDRAGFMNNLAQTKTENNTKTEGNDGFWERKKMINGGSVNMCGRLHCDIFNSDRYLLNKVNITITVKFSSPDFCLLWSEDNKKYGFHMETMVLMLRKVKISPAVANAHNNTLMKSLACYPIKRTSVNDFSIDTVGKKFATTILDGKIPSRLVLGLVTNSAFMGNRKENPFNFEHFNMTKLSLKCNGVLSPYKEPLEFDFEKNNYMSGFRTLFDGIDNSERGNNISRYDYANGFTLFAFDFTPDMCSSDHFNLEKTGSITVAIEFSKAVNKSLTLIVFSEYDDIIYIDKNRQVIN
jgi:hypothetical protein